jgi:hypothetical protein
MMMVKHSDHIQIKMSKPSQPTKYEMQWSHPEAAPGVFLRIPWNTQDFGEKNKYISVYMYSLYYLIRKKHTKQLAAQ